MVQPHDTSYLSEYAHLSYLNSHLKGYGSGSLRSPWRLGAFGLLQPCEPWQEQNWGRPDATFMSFFVASKGKTIEIQLWLVGHGYKCVYNSSSSQSDQSHTLYVSFKSLCFHHKLWLLGWLPLGAECIWTLFHCDSRLINLDVKNELLLWSALCLLPDVLLQLMPKVFHRFRCGDSGVGHCLMPFVVCYCVSTALLPSRHSHCSNCMFHLPSSVVQADLQRELKEEKLRNVILQRWEETSLCWCMRSGLHNFTVQSAILSAVCVYMIGPESTYHCKKTMWLNVLDMLNWQLSRRLFGRSSKPTMSLPCL